MYFKSRVEAGQLLAGHIVPKYLGHPCAVVALSDGGVVVASQVALQLHCVLTMLLSEPITLPREPVAIAGISQDGAFSYNHGYSDGEIQAFVSEYYQYIEQEKMQKIQEMHRLIGQGGLVRKDLLRDKIVILVTDGLEDGFALDVAMEFLKPIHMRKLVIATPLASVSAVDRMHVLADEIFCESVINDYMGTDHYYDTQDVPPRDKIIHTVREIVSKWQ